MADDKDPVAVNTGKPSTVTTTSTSVDTSVEKP